MAIQLRCCSRNLPRCMLTAITQPRSGIKPLADSSSLLTSIPSNVILITGTKASSTAYNKPSSITITAADNVTGLVVKVTRRVNQHFDSCWKLYKQWQGHHAKIAPRFTNKSTHRVGHFKALPTSGVLQWMTLLEIQPLENVRVHGFFLKKKAQPTVFLEVLLGFGHYWVFSDFSFEQAGGKLVGWFSSSAKLLFRFTSTLDNLKIHIFITYWSLEAVNIKKSLVITGMTNYNRIKFGAGFFSRFYPKKPSGFFLGITRVSEPSNCATTLRSSAVVQIHRVHMTSCNLQSLITMLFDGSVMIPCFCLVVNTPQSCIITFAHELPDWLQFICNSLIV